MNVKRNVGSALLLLVPLTVVTLVMSVYGQMDEIPRDTSFTVQNTIPKVLKQYPQAKVVQAILPAEVLARENVPYAQNSGRPLHLDLFSPRREKMELFPAVLLIHGGGWRSGYRQMEWPMAQQLAAQGYVAATVEYRLSPESQYPAAIHDLKAAIRWLRANASQLSVDANKIAVYGCSAGGELATFLGATGNIRKFEGDLGNPGFSSRVQAVVNVDGIVDFTDPAESAKDTDPKKPSAGKAWFGASFAEKPELWQEASPINYVDSTMPPILFLNSSLERYHAGRDQMITQLSNLGIYSEIKTMADSPHPFWLFHPWFQSTFETVLQFLDKTLKR